MLTLSLLLLLLLVFIYYSNTNMCWLVLCMDWQCTSRSTLWSGVWACTCSLTMRRKCGLYCLLGIEWSSLYLLCWHSAYSLSCSIDSMAMSSSMKVISTILFAKTIELISPSISISFIWISNLLVKSPVFSLSSLSSQLFWLLSGSTRILSFLFSIRYFSLSYSTKYVQLNTSFGTPPYCLWFLPKTICF